jgi:lysophospholipase L1-like esterase
LIAFIALILLRRTIRLGGIGIQIVNTLILFIAVLPVADFLIPSNQEANAVDSGSVDHSRVTSNESRYDFDITAENAHRLYSYEEAKGDPRALRRWRRFLYYQLNFVMNRDIFEADTNRVRGFRLRPNSQGRLLDCPVHINSLGFRGKEIAIPKGDVYRIVALGESTTFGITIKANDQPWPELLEKMIQERIKPRRPIEVINAGIPAYELKDNLLRLPGEILPLHPDMIISYHGYNGFDMIEKALPPIFGPPPPSYPKRPSRLGAEIEYRTKMAMFLHRYGGKMNGTKPVTSPPLQTEYADAYRELIQFSRTNGIRLALANYCMAITKDSDPKVTDFYQYFGHQAASIGTMANSIHSEIIRQLTAQNPDVCFVDTHSNLDGDHRKFIDLVHLTQEGRNQLAENVFAAIQKTLAKDLMKTNKANLN